MQAISKDFIVMDLKNYSKPTVEVTVIALEINIMSNQNERPSEDEIFPGGGDEE